MASDVTRRSVLVGALAASSAERLSSAPSSQGMQPDRAQQPECQLRKTSNQQSDEPGD